MHHYEALQQLARDHGDERRREASAERLALAPGAGATRRSRRWRVAVGAALRLRSPSARRGEHSPAYRPSA